MIRGGGEEVLGDDSLCVSLSLAFSLSLFPFSLRTTVCQYASDMITKYNHRRTRESAGFSVNRMLLCVTSRAPSTSAPLLLFLLYPCRRPLPAHLTAYILYQTHPSVRPLKHIASPLVKSVSTTVMCVCVFTCQTHTYTEMHRHVRKPVETAWTVPTNKSVSSVLHICVTCFCCRYMHAPPTPFVCFFCSRIYLLRERLQRESHDSIATIAIGIRILRICMEKRENQYKIITCALIR